MSEACQCPADGFCQRYQRQMSGRLREICRGENIAPEKAAKYRENWSHLSLEENGSGELPPLTPFQLATNLMAASVRWRLAGMPMRSAEEVERIFKENCAGCPLARPREEAGTLECSPCGCRLSSDVDEWNKIALATESCPVGKW